MERNIEINIETISTGFFFYQDLYALFSCLKLVENYVCTFLYFEDVDKLRYKDMDQTRECSRAQLWINSQCRENHVHTSEDRRNYVSQEIYVWNVW